MELWHVVKQEREQEEGGHTLVQHSFNVHPAASANGNTPSDRIVPQQLLNNVNNGKGNNMSAQDSDYTSSYQYE